MRYIDRCYKKTLVLIPGWATDSRIFDSLNLRFNYILLRYAHPSGFESSLLRALDEHRIPSISLFGWSLGGFIAAEFASKHGNLIDNLILVSIRKRYKKSELDYVRERVKINKKAYLHKFYSQCFYRQDEFYRSKGYLFDAYCEHMQLDWLLEGLDYLGCAEINANKLQNINRLIIVHGDNDKIAPVEEALSIKNSLPKAEFSFVKNAAHMPFLENNFNIDI